MLKVFFFYLFWGKAGEKMLHHPSSRSRNNATRSCILVIRILNSRVLSISQVTFFNGPSFFRVRSVDKKKKQTKDTIKTYAYIVLVGSWWRLGKKIDVSKTIVREKMSNRAYKAVFSSPSFIIKGSSAWNGSIVVVPFLWGQREREERERKNTHTHAQSYDLTLQADSCMPVFFFYTLQVINA